MYLALPAFIGGVGPWEMLIILAVILIVFGGRKIPQLAKDLGSGIREFRQSLSNSQADLSIEDDSDRAPQKTSARRKTPAAPKKKRS